MSGCNNGNENLLRHIKQLLDEYVFTHIWNIPCNINANHFLCIFKQPVIDGVIQTWFSNKALSNILELYNNCKYNLVNLDI